MARPRLRILALDPDPDCREELRRRLVERFPLDSVVAAPPEASDQVLATGVPALVLLSALTPASSEDRLMRHLKQADPDGIVPVLSVPPFVAAHAAEAESRRFAVMFKRAHEPEVARDPELVMARIGETLARLRDECARPRPARMRVRAASDPPPADQTQGTCQALMRLPAPPPFGTSLARSRQDRASRLTPPELPFPCSLTTTAGAVVRLLNVSNTGVLFESRFKFMPDTEASLYLVGPESSITLPLRFVRSEVSAVEACGVTYRTAATFHKELDLVASLMPRGDRPTETLRALADLLVAVTTRHSARGDYAGARVAYEAGLRRMLPACEVKLRDALVRPAAGRESIYFTIPTPWGGILQATFNAAYAPSPEEFVLLKTAAAAAAVILQFEAAGDARRTA